MCALELDHVFHLDILLVFLILVLVLDLGGLRRSFGTCTEPISKTPLVRKTASLVQGGHLVQRCAQVHLGLGNLGFERLDAPVIVLAESTEKPVQ